MSKSSNLSYKDIVEIVDNLHQILIWISSSLEFWHVDTCYPCNLIKQCCDDYAKKLEKILNEKYKN